MYRTLLSLLGLLMVSVPRAVVDAGERVAFENPSEAVLRRWTIPMARLEGMAYFVLARGRGGPRGGLAAIVGLFGAFAALMPRRYLNFGLGLAYANSRDISVKPWVIPATRAVGFAVGVLTALSLLGRREEGPRLD